MPDNNYIELPIDKIIVSDNFGCKNPKSRAYDQLKTHIKDHGLLTPIKINRDHELVEGWFRFLACRELELKKIIILIV